MNYEKPLDEMHKDALARKETAWQHYTDFAEYAEKVLMIQEYGEFAPLPPRTRWFTKRCPYDGSKLGAKVASSRMLLLHCSKCPYEWVHKMAPAWV